MSQSAADETSARRWFRCRLGGHIQDMTDDPHPPPSQPGDAGPAKQQPAITQRDRKRPEGLGPEDVDAGPEGEYPDPDEYAGTDDH
jgi:hypothetical protein